MAAAARAQLLRKSASAIDRVWLNHPPARKLISRGIGSPRMGDGRSSSTPTSATSVAGNSRSLDQVMPRRV